MQKTQYMLFSFFLLKTTHIHFLSLLPINLLTMSAGSTIFVQV